MGRSTGGNAKAYYTQKQREWRAANRERARETARVRREESRALIRANKDIPCMDCGEEFPSYVMQFDHREPALKLFTIGSSAGAYTREEILAEIAKCDVVCANCHAIRTFGQKREG